MVSDDELMERLVLKGGTAISMIYDLTSRTSLDLDFSMADAFEEESIEEVEAQIERTLRMTFREHDYDLFDFKMSKKPDVIAYDIADFWGGYEVLFKLVRSDVGQTYTSLEDRRRRALVLGKDGSTKFSIDISSYEYCQPATISEIDDLRLRVYTPAMIVLEKVRATCQQLPDYQKIIHSHTSRNRSRDFYDIGILLDEYKIDFNSDENRNTLMEIFKAKHVPIEYVLQIRGRRDLYRENFNTSLAATISAKEDILYFDTYFDLFVDTFEPIVQSILAG